MAISACEDHGHWEEALIVFQDAVTSFVDVDSSLRAEDLFKIHPWAASVGRIGGLDCFKQIVIYSKWVVMSDITNQKRACCYPFVS